VDDELIHWIAGFKEGFKVKEEKEEEKEEEEEDRNTPKVVEGSSLKALEDRIKHVGVQTTGDTRRVLTPPGTPPYIPLGPDVDTPPCSPKVRAPMMPPGSRINYFAKGCRRSRRHWFVMDRLRRHRAKERALSEWHAACREWWKGYYEAKEDEAKEGVGKVIAFLEKNPKPKSSTFFG